MSADSIEVCPACHPEILVNEGPLYRIGEGLNTGLREYHEIYLENGPGGVELVGTYHAICWDCGFETKTIEFRVPVLDSPLKVDASEMSFDFKVKGQET